MNHVAWIAVSIALVGACKEAPSQPSENLLTPGSPGLPFETLTFGAARKELLAAAAKFGDVVTNEIEVDNAVLRPRGFRDASIKLFFEDKRGTYERATVYFPDGTDAAVLAEKAWGAPIVGSDHGTELKIWINPANRTRAYVSKQAPKHLELQHYTPLEMFVGTTGKQLAFEARQPIIGATKDQLVAAYGLENGKIRLPPSACEDVFLTVFVKFDDAGKARGYQVDLENDYCDRDPKTLKQVMEAKFGAPKPLGDALMYSDDPNLIALQDKSDGIQLGVLPRPTEPAQ